jgi:ligand-binding SRPBCC domain-containing protein
MPAFAVTQEFPFPLPAVFAFFRRPANVVAVAPPALGLRLVSGPEVLEVGSRISVRSRRWGVSALVVTEVVELVEPERIVEEQVSGPLRRWRHERHFRAAGEALTEVSERIDYEPPSGLLGLTLTPRVIEAELAEAFRWRQARVVELLGGSS